MSLSFGEQVDCLLEKIQYQWELIFRYSTCPFGSEYQEAWNHRYELFSQFDEGIQMDAIGLYSVTPEKIAKEIAWHSKGYSVLDAFCGIGGNSLAFAAVCSRVYAVDNSSLRLDMAANNALVYNRNNIQFLKGDCLEIIPIVKADLIFLDPPWGGPGYIKKAHFQLADFSPNGFLLLAKAFQYYKKVILRVPVNFSMADLDVFNNNFIVENNILAGKLLSKTIYFD